MKHRVHHGSLWTGSVHSWFSMFFLFFILSFMIADSLSCLSTSVENRSSYLRTVFVAREESGILMQDRRCSCLSTSLHPSSQSNPFLKCFCLKFALSSNILALAWKRNLDSCVSNILRTKTGLQGQSLMSYCCALVWFGWGTQVLSSQYFCPQDFELCCRKHSNLIIW